MSNTRRQEQKDATPGSGSGRHTGLARLADHVLLHRRRIFGWRAAAAAAIVLLSALAIDRKNVGGAETAVFEAINDLPGPIYPVIWPVMQLGSFVAPLLLGSVAAAARRFRLAVDALVAGTIAWFLARFFKDLFGRPRPRELLDEVITRGDPATGLGFVSGHSAMAFALATVVSAWLPRRAQIVAWAVAAIVGLARIYVGAHLPLDVIGGAAVGWAIGSLVHFVIGAPHPHLNPSGRRTTERA